MTTQPRLTADEEADIIVSKHAAVYFAKPKPMSLRITDDEFDLRAAIAAALRKRDELYAKAWEECKNWRYYYGNHYRECGCSMESTNAHDAARKEKGLA